MVSLAEFYPICDIVINQLEGGYYHPDMLKDGRIKDIRYSASGETMFGIDRKYTPDPVFWAIIDKAGARTKWQWNYMGGSLGPTLRKAAADIIYKLFAKYYTAYLSPAAKAAVDNNYKLLFHFIYATWNGPGWFKKFAQDINVAIASGLTDPNALVDVALTSRTQEGLTDNSAPNSIIAQGGNKIATIFNSATYAATFKKKNNLQQA